MTHELGPTMMTRDECVLSNMGVLDMASCEGRDRHSLQSSNNLIPSTISPQKRPSNQPVDVREASKKLRSRPLKFLCQVPDCQEKFRNAEHLEAHMKLHEGVKPFTCSVCGVVCKTESKLTAHLAKHATDNVKSKCDICDRNFSSRSAVQKHKKMLHKPKPHICPHCSAGFEAHKYMAVHIKRAHGEDPPAEEEVSQSSEPLTNFHPDTTSPDQRAEKKQVSYSMTEKDESFHHPSVPVSSYQLLSQAHSNPSHHLREQSNPAQCDTHQIAPDQADSPQCSTYQLPQEQVDSPGYDSLHQTRKHLDAPQCESRKKSEENIPINCELCTSTFPNLAYLEQHMAVHLNERIVGCPNLEQGNHPKSLAVSSDHRAFSCTNGNFGQFMLSPSQPAVVRGLQESNKFICVSCNEQFLSLGSLKRHEARICTQQLTKL